MWATSDGLRVLKGAERELFVEGAKILLENDLIALSYESEGADSDFVDGVTGVEVFDSMPPRQRIWSLGAVLLYLVYEDIPAPEAMAWMEATIYAVYRTIALEIGCEIDDTDDEGLVSLKLQTMVQTAIDSRGCWDLWDDEDGFVPSWNDNVEMLVDQILWDRDFQMAREFLDADPDRAANAKAMMGISDQYFIACPPEVSEENVKLAVCFVQSFDKFQAVIDQKV